MVRLLLKHPIFSQSTTEKHVDTQQKGWQTGSRVQGSFLDRVINLELKKNLIWVPVYTTDLLQRLG